MTLTGYVAIEYAERNGLTLSKFADPTEDFRENLTVAEARKVAAEDPNLIYIENVQLKALRVRPDSNDIEFHLGEATAYGSYALDDETGNLIEGSVDHAPTQPEYDAIAAAIDAMSDDEFICLVTNAKTEGEK